MNGPNAPHIHNPSTMHAPRGYSHVAEVPAGNRLIFIAGQVALDKDYNLVGAGDLRAQTKQAFENLRLALESAGATLQDVVKFNFYVLDASQIVTIREVRDGYINTSAPPASTLVEVRRLAQEDWLVEVEAVAVAPQR